jgi:flagellar basal body-associated protein FliL
MKREMKMRKHNKQRLKQLLGDLLIMVLIVVAIAGFLGVVYLLGKP